MGFWNKKEETQDKTTWEVELDPSKANPVAGMAGQSCVSEKATDRDKTPMEVLEQKVRILEDARKGHSDWMQVVHDLQTRVHHQQTLINLLMGILEKKEDYVEAVPGHYILVDVEQEKQPGARKR